jgi:tetratricopeptide (TPR) repeat protein
MGCSQARTEPVIDIKSPEIESRPKSTRFCPLPNQQSDRIVEDCIVIWLLNDSSLEIEVERTKLSHVVSTVKTFSDRDEYITYITNIQVEKIFLIVPAIESFLNSIQNLPQIEKIYVLNPSLREIEKNQDVTTSSNIFYDIDNLCKQLEIDVELCELDLVTISTSALPSQDGATSDDMKKQEAFFLYGQLKREILYRLKFENNAKNEFINFCRLHYTNNIEQLRMIDDFETNYRPQKALWWLIRPCFIRHVLQRTQRTSEIDILYKLGFLLKHAHTQLTIFQENNSFISKNVLIVYRGKTMFNDKFNTLVKNNCGGLLSFDNFFVAHTDKEADIDFVRRRLAAFPNATGILFEIHINPAVRSVRSPFASLDTVYGDDNIEKNGILFGTAAVFHIDFIEQCTVESAITIWNVKLTLISDEDQQLLRIVAPLRSSEVHANPLSYMGKLFMEMGQYTQAEQFFLGMLEDASVRGQPRRLVRVHNGLGANYMHKGDYTKALEQYQQALDVSLSYLPPTHTDLAPLYDSIGKSYFHLGKYQKAVENYERAADLIGLNAQPGNDQFVNDLNTRIDSAKKLLNKNK